MSPATVPGRLRAIALVTAILGSFASCPGCVETRRSLGEDCLKDDDCLSGVCSQLRCAAVPFTTDAAPVADVAAENPIADARAEAQDAAAVADVATESPIADARAEAQDAAAEASEAAPDVAADSGESGDELQTPPGEDAPSDGDTRVD